MVKYWQLVIDQKTSKNIKFDLNKESGCGTISMDSAYDIKESFVSDVSIDDIILIFESNNSIYLTEVVSNYISEKEYTTNELYTKLLILDAKTEEEFIKSYQEEKGSQITSIFDKQKTFALVENQDFADWWYITTLKTLAKKHAIIADIRSVRDILRMDLRIPPYQRPYKWEKDQVVQLLNDIKNDLSKTQSNSRYRIGSLILCIDAEKIEEKWDRSIDIVDGQQRITTILLILNYLQYEYESNLETRLKYNTSISYDNMKTNQGVIENWFEKNKEIKEKFAKHLLDKCELVFVKVFEISQAFQMFDSQNGTGKPLAPYNLLKAYHLNSIKDSNIQKECDIEWEKAGKFYSDIYETNLDLLNQLFSEQLYKTRIWTRNKIPEPFTREDIKEFKGNDFENQKSNFYSYQLNDLLYYLSEKMESGAILDGYHINPLKTACAKGEYDIRNFMQITNTITNGNYFFKYTDTYVNIYKELFLTSSDKTDFQNFYQTHCFYPKWDRDGDTYLRKLYESLIIRLYDRFGSDNFTEYNYKLLFFYVYQYRLLLDSVRYKGVRKLPVEKDNNPFMVIQYATSPDDLEVLKKDIILKESRLQEIENEHNICIQSKGKVREKGSYVPKLILFFKNEYFNKANNQRITND